MFTPIPRATAVDVCAARLRAAVLGGQIPPGVRLPAERELSRRFGVNRVTLRAALGRLAGARLVEVRHGSGYRVRDFLREGGPDLIADLAQAGGRAGLPRIAADLLLVRRQLAAAVLERLPLPLPAPALAGLTRAVAALTSAAASGASATRMAVLDLEVTGALVAATGSEVLQLCLNPIAAVLGRLPGLRAALYRDPEQSVLAWQALLALLAAGEAPGPVMLEALRLHDEATLAALAPSRRPRAPVSVPRETSKARATPGPSPHHRKPTLRTHR